MTVGNMIADVRAMLSPVRDVVSWYSRMEHTRIISIQICNPWFKAPHPYGCSPSHSVSELPLVLICPHHPSPSARLPSVASPCPPAASAPGSTAAPDGRPSWQGSRRSNPRSAADGTTAGPTASWKTSFDVKGGKGWKRGSEFQEIFGDAGISDMTWNMLKPEMGQIDGIEMDLSRWDLDMFETTPAGKQLFISLKFLVGEHTHNCYSKQAWQS